MGVGSWVHRERELATLSNTMLGVSILQNEKVCTHKPPKACQLPFWTPVAGLKGALSVPVYFPKKVDGDFSF